MCNSKANGGRRCAIHSPEGRRTSRYATALYGANTTATRAQVDALPPKFVGGSITQRAKIAEATGDPEVLRLALIDKDAVALGALRNPNVAPAVLDAAASNSSDEAFAVIDNPNTRIDTLRRLVDSGKGTVQRVALARLMARGEDVNGYVKNGTDAVREELATRTADPRMRAALLDDVSPLVRERAVLNRHVNSGLPLTIADDPSAKVKLAAAKVTNNSDLLNRLARTNDVRVQDEIMKNPACTDDVLQTMALGGSENAHAELVRKGLAGRSTETVLRDREEASEFEVQIAYENEANGDIRRLLAAHHAASDDIRIAHLKEQSAEHLITLAEGHASPRLLAGLAKNRNEDVRLAVIVNENTPEKIIRHFATLKNPKIARAAREELARRG